MEIINLTFILFRYADHCCCCWQYFFCSFYGYLEMIWLGLEICWNFDFDGKQVQSVQSKWQRKKRWKKNENKNKIQTHSLLTQRYDDRWAKRDPWMKSNNKREINIKKMKQYRKVVMRMHSKCMVDRPIIPESNVSNHQNGKVTDTI